MRPLLVAVAALVVAACHRNVEEPDPTKIAVSSSSASTSDAAAPLASTSTSPAPSSSDGMPDPDAPFSPKEYKEFHTRISNELCEQAAKKNNQVNGRPDFDKKGTLIITACLMEGNVAWYRCVLTTDTAEHFNWCSKRYLIPQDEAKLQK